MAQEQIPPPLPEEKKKNNFFSWPWPAKPTVGFVIVLFILVFGTQWVAKFLAEFGNVPKSSKLLGPTSSINPGMKTYGSQGFQFDSPIPLSPNAGAGSSQSALVGHNNAMVITYASTVGGPNVEQGILEEASQNALNKMARNLKSQILSRSFQESSISDEPAILATGEMQYNGRPTKVSVLTVTKSGTLYQLVAAQTNPSPAVTKVIESVFASVRFSAGKPQKGNLPPTPWMSVKHTVGVENGRWVVELETTNVSAQTILAVSGNIYITDLLENPVATFPFETFERLNPGSSFKKTIEQPPDSPHVLLLTSKGYLSNDNSNKLLSLTTDKFNSKVAVEKAVFLDEAGNKVVFPTPNK